MLVFAMGASVGSFLNVVADRTPAGRSLVRPRSYCPSCERPLSNIELVPILSYLWLRGRCRTCGVGIPPRTVLVEIVTALLFTAVYLRFGYSLQFVVMSAAVSLLIVVAVIDLEHGLILNRIVLPGLAILLILAPFWPQLEVSRTFLGSSGMVASLASSVVAGGGAFLLFLGIALAYPNSMGRGDVKLAGLLGLLLGFPGVLVALWGAVVSGGLVAILLLALRKKGRKDAIPFGPFLSLGGIVVLLAGSDIILGYQGLVDRFAG
jgi:leader peptidase (prepilin peptidase)/N-methyltransferase